MKFVLPPDFAVYRLADEYDYAAARKRLQAITTDAAALDSFERVAQSGEVNDEFLEAVGRLNISLDHVFADRGEPFLPAEGMANA